MTARSFNEHDVILKYFQAHPRPGVMLDVGAMLGSSFQAFTELEWQIYAFEPDPQKNLREAFHGQPEVHLFDCALSDEPGQEIPFFSSPESQGISTLKPFLPSHREVAKVEVKTLTEVMRGEKLRRVDYLKVDTEGFDLKVLRGFPWRRPGFDLLRRSCRPEIVLCEFDDYKSAQQHFTHQDLGQFLLAQGYEVYLSEWRPIEEYGRPHSWVSVRLYPCDLIHPRSWGNFIAVSRRSHPETLRRLLLDAAVADRTRMLETLLHRDQALANLKGLERTMRERTAEIHDLKRAIHKRDETIAQLKETLSQKDQGLVRLTDTLEERNAGMEQRLESIHDLQEALHRKDESLARLKETVQEKDQGLERLRVSVAERNAGMEKRLADIHALKEAIGRRDEVLDRLKESVRQKDEGLARLREGLAQKDTAIAELRERIVEKNETLRELKGRLDGR